MQFLFIVTEKFPQEVARPLLAGDSRRVLIRRKTQAAGRAARGDKGMRRSGEQREAADPPVPRGFPDALPAGGGDTTGEADGARRRDSSSPCCSSGCLSLPRGDTPAGHCCCGAPCRVSHDRAYSQFLPECRTAGGGATRATPSGDNSAPAAPTPGAAPGRLIMRRPTNETPRPTRRCTRPVPARRPPGGDVQCALSSVSFESSVSSVAVCVTRVSYVCVAGRGGAAWPRAVSPCRLVPCRRSAAPRCLCHRHIVTASPRRALLSFKCWWPQQRSVRHGSRASTPPSSGTDDQHPSFLRPGVLRRAHHHHHHHPPPPPPANEKDKQSESFLHTG
ncbi:uncharacterized protein LOC135090202 [Scylla paramamosain]|uniref:uncharacterized protein LOC135090202 n=1 Tax=Scylla paramamosain TaxID=85552 RepID=UPI003082DEE2